MLHLNSRLCAVIAVGLSLLAVPGLEAQSTSEAPAAIRGDVDGDGRVTRADADAVRAFLVRGTVPAGRSILPAGDANGDGRVTAADAALISRFAAGVDVSRFPVGRPVGAGQTGPGGGGTLQTGDQFCMVDVKAGTITCREVLEGGVSANVILGSPYVTYVTTSGYSNGNSADEDTMNYTVAITNATPQPLGTTDGINLAPDGVRLFFSTKPVVTKVSSGDSATAVLKLETPDGTATFTNQNGSATYSNRPYFQYNEVLAPGDTSAARSMKFIYGPNVASFYYSYRVSAPAQYEHGYITISPASTPILTPGQTTTLTGTVYNQVGQVQADGITWSSSNPAAATVNASTGEVTAVGVGTTTITATSTVNAQRKGTRVITVDAAPTVVSTTPTNGDTDILPDTTIGITFSEDVNVTEGSFALECPAGSNIGFTLSGTGASYTLTPAAPLPALTTCTVTVEADSVEDTDAADPPNTMVEDYVFSFTTVIKATNDTFPEVVLGNVSVNSANADTSFNVLANDVRDGSTTISAAGWDADGPGGAALESGKTENGGNVSITAAGTFSYDPPAGFTGTDRFNYVLQRGSYTTSGTVSLTVAGMVWFVSADSSACSSVASNCGRMSKPFKTLKEFSEANVGGGNNPKDNQPVFVYESASVYADSVTLRSGQKLIGQDATASLESLATLSPPPSAPDLPVMNSGNLVKVTIASAGVNVAQNNALYGFTLQTTLGEAIGGSNFGTLTLANGTSQAADVTISAGGQALGLTNGTVSGTFASVSSAGGINNVSLTNVNSASAISFGAGALANSSGGAIKISGGNVSLTIAGTVSQTTIAPLLDVSNAHSGALAFTAASALSANAGTGLQFSGVTGTYTFAGTTDLNGGNAGIDILSSSTGTFTFGASTLVNNPTGTAFTVNGSTPNVTFNGSLFRTANNALLVDLTDVASGTITFDPAAADSLYATVGDGIRLSNVDGAVDFNGRVRLAGGNAGVDIVSGSTGNIDFDAASIVNPTGEALRISNASGGNQATDVSFAGSIQTNAGRPVLVEGMASGAVAVSASLNTTAGQGVLVQNNSGGTVTFSHGTKSLTTTVANAAVTLANNTGATVNFTGGGLAITTATGAGFSATGGGTVNVTGSVNTVSSNGGVAVNVANTTIGASGMEFRSVAATGGSNGIVLNATGNSGGGFTVTGTGTAGSGGSIVNTTGADGATAGNGVYLNDTRRVSLNWMALSGHANNGLFGTGVRGLTLDKMRFTGTNGSSNSGTFNESAVHLTNLGGAVKFSGSRFDGGAYNAVRVDNSDGAAPALDSLVFVNDTIATMQGSTADVRGSALLVNLMDGTADVRIRDSRVLAWWSTGIHVLSQGTASATARITNNFVDNTNGALAGAMGIVAAGCRLGFNISGNTVRHTNGAAISTDMSPGCVNTVQGTIDGNFIGVSGDTNSGTATGVAIAAGGRAGTTTVKISNNVLRQINGSANGAITVVAGDNVLYGGSGTLNATISGNNIQETGSTVNSAQHGILVTHGTTSSGANDSHQGCYDILSNTIANLNTASGAAAQNRIRVNQRFGTTSRFPGYTGGQFSTTDLASYLLARNTASNATNANTSTGGFLNTVPAGSACPQPTM